MKIANSYGGVWVGNLRIAETYKRSKTRTYLIPGQLVEIETLGQGVGATGYDVTRRIG